MRIFVPYTRLEPEVLPALDGYDATPVELIDGDSYSEYFARRWIIGENFINVEHDIVVPPGAIAGLIECPKPWCFHDYVAHPESYTGGVSHRPPAHPVGPRHGVATFGLVRFRAEIIEATQECWRYPVHWRQCDSYFLAYAEDLGFTPHEHAPWVVDIDRPAV